MRSPAAAAFSLLETVLALGVVSTVLVAAMSLIPLGLRTAQEAEGQAAEMRILQRLGDRCAALMPDEALYFSSNGSPVSGKSGDALYAVIVRPGSGICLPGNLDRPLRSALVEIRNLSTDWRLHRTLLLPP